MIGSRAVIAAAGVAGVSFAVLVAPAAAHVTNEPTEVAAGSFASITLTVPHGCDDAPTSGLTIEIPEGVTNVSPQVHPGWQIGIEPETLAEPIDTGEGEPITERTSVVTFTADPENELPGHHRDQFTIGYRAPDTAGEYLFFKTIQTCPGGAETAWIEEYTGEGEEPEHPSPAVLLTEATGDGHGGGEAEEPEAEAGAEEETAATISAEPVSDTDDSSDGVAIAALVVAVLALVLGGAALVVARRG